MEGTSGSLTVKGAENGGVGIDNRGGVEIEENVFLVAIGGKGASGISQTSMYFSSENSLVISGTLQGDGSIEQEYSGLSGSLTLGVNIEIPWWATVTIPKGQSITIPAGSVLTNNGTLINNGTLDGDGSISNQGTFCYGESGTSSVQIQNENGGKEAYDIVVIIQDPNRSPVTDNRIHLYDPQHGELAFNSAKDGKYTALALPVNQIGYDLRVDNYPIGTTIIFSLTGRTVEVIVFNLYFKIGEDTPIQVYRVAGQPVPPYKPANSVSGHTLKWYADEAYTTPMTDWSDNEGLKEQTIYGRWEPDYKPDPEPEPTPVFYTVTLPSVEGAVTDPMAGSYLVESWGSFHFYLTINTAYSQSQPVVTTSRNETLMPRAFDGAYVVGAVSTDVQVFIDGLVKNPPPVTNEPIPVGDDLPEIWVECSSLCIRLTENTPVVPIRILTPGGGLVYSFRSLPGVNRWQLPTGIYIVQIGDNRGCKVIVR